MVPLLPEETKDLLAGRPVTGQLEPDDELVARLAAKGLSTEVIAKRLSMSPRSVQRRLARLRDRVGAHSKAELSTLLSRRGF